MYHHVVAFRFKPGVTDAEVNHLTHDLRALSTSLSGLVSYACGPDLGLRQGNDDFAIAAIFETEDALTAYLEHPAHQTIIAKHVPTLVAERHGAQFTLA